MAKEISSKKDAEKSTKKAAPKKAAAKTKAQPAAKKKEAFLMTIFSLNLSMLIAQN